MFVRQFVLHAVVVMGQMHIELYAGDGRSLLAGNVEVISAQLELFELAPEFARVNAQINQRRDEHVAADAAENVEIKRLHFIVLFASSSGPEVRQGKPGH